MPQSCCTFTPVDSINFFHRTITLYRPIASLSFVAESSFVVGRLSFNVGVAAIIKKILNRHRPAPSPIHCVK
jgi:hypothetical protein